MTPQRRGEGAVTRSDQTERREVTPERGIETHRDLEDERRERRASAACDRRQAQVA